MRITNWLLLTAILILGGCSEPRQSITGIGVSLRAKGDAVEIDSVLPHTPAAKAGLHSGLVIQQIDGINVVGKSLVVCVSMTRGPVGSKVQFEVVDPSTSKISLVEFKREKITLPAGASATAGWP